MVHVPSLRARVLAPALALTLFAGVSSAFAQQPPTTTSVSVSGTSFLPATVHVAPGATIKWSNTSLDQHTITSVDGTFDSGPLAPGDSFTVTLDQPGEYQYFCQFHGTADMDGMAATIVVDDPSTNPAPAAPQRTGDDYQPTEAD